MTHEQKWLSRKYLVYTLFSNFWFSSAVWLYFYRLYISDRQVGILDALAFGLGLIAEVPSGALADRFGRDRLVRFGQILAGLGMLIQAVGGSFTILIIGQAVLMIGISFVSGADQALFFDQLKFNKDSVDWRKLLTRISQVSLFAMLFATMVGGWAFSLNSHIPMILSGFSFIISAFLVWNVRDERVLHNYQKLSHEVREHLSSIMIGFKQFWFSDLRFYLPLIIFVEGLLYAYGWGIFRIVLLDRFHFSPLSGAIVIAMCSIISIGALSLLHRYAHRISEKQILFSFSLSIALVLLLSIWDIGSWGFFVILILYAGEFILFPYVSEIINNRAPVNTRATVLSVASFLKALPYVLLAPIIGYLNNIERLEYFFAIWSVFIFFALFVYAYKQKRFSRNNVQSMSLSDV